MPLPHIDIHKVDDRPEADAVHQIAQCAPQHQPQPGTEPGIEAGAAQQGHDGHGGHHGRAQEQPELPLDVGTVQKAEGSAPVVDQHQIQQAGDDRHGLQGIDGGHGPPLGQLVKDQRQQAVAAQDRIFAHYASGSSAMTLAQRGQRVGCAGSLPSSVL